MNDSNINSKGFWTVVLIALVIGYVIGGAVKKHSFNIRSFTKSDTIYTEDSVYKVRFKIDSVWKNDENYYEPAERN